MSDFDVLNNISLSSLLTKQHTYYKKFIKDGTKEELELCKSWITLLQKEINLRKQPAIKL